MRARVTIDAGRVVGVVDPMIYGQYLEHVQPEDRCIYGAVLDEGSPLADAHGYREDVVAAVRELDVPVVRWPGGCFADIYRWEDGVGPRDARPVRRNWHWGGVESNRFGTDEFLRWCERVGAAPYVNVNLGTGTLGEAIRWLDYCNGSDPTADVLRRAANGHPAPYGVPFWGVGNEQWGDWEAGHMDARTYAAALRNWAQFLRKLDPQARLLGIGSPMARDPEWDVEVLRRAGNLLDYLTLHIYGHTVVNAPADDEYYPTVAQAVYVEEQLRRMAATVAAASGYRTRETPLRIAVDEWNIRHLVRSAEGSNYSEGHRLVRDSPRTMQDAVFAAGVFHAMLRLAPVVGMANYVFLLNGNGVLLVGPDGIVKTPLYDLFRLYRRHMQPVVLDTQVESESFVTAVRQERLDVTTDRSVPYLDAVATRDVASRVYAVAIINRHRDEAAAVEIVAAGVSEGTRMDVWDLAHDDVRAANDFGQPDRVRARHRAEEWTRRITVPPHAVTLIRVVSRR